MTYTPESFESLRIQLEQASKIAFSPNVSKEQRLANERILEEFEKSRSPYEFCRYLLQKSDQAYVHFEAVKTLQIATLREWSILPSNLVNDLQNFLFSYVINDVYKQQKFVQQQILRTIAVFYKRNKLSNLNSQNKSLVQEIIELFKSADVKLKRICCSLMLALLSEFSNTDRSSKLGLSGDSHFTAKRSFEQNELKLLLVFIFETTQDLIGSLRANNIRSVKLLDRDVREMLMNLFELIEQSFAWEFTSSKHVLKNLIGNFKQTTSQTNVATNLEPTPEFKEFFLNPNLISLLFSCYELVRDDVEMAHACIQSIIQLSTLNGPLFREDENSQMRVAFFTSFVQIFLTTFTEIQIKEYEWFNLACLIENLLSASNVKVIYLIDFNIVESFFNLLCGFLLSCFKAEKTCSDSSDSGKYLESYEKVVVSWSNIRNIVALNENQANIDLVDSIFKNYSQPLVEGFIQSRLCFNYDTDKEVIQVNDDSVDAVSLDDDDSNEDDLHRYKEILYSIGEFAKFSLDYSLPMLAKLLNEKYINLIELLKQISMSKQQGMDTKLLTTHLTSLSEDMHWLLLITGFLVFEINSDQSKIPEHIMKYSIKCSNYIDLNQISNLFATLNQFASIPAVHSSQTICSNLIDLRMDEKFDPIIRLFLNAFQLSELEIHMFSLNMLEYLSPQVASTLIWFLTQMTESYLYMNEQMYNEISASLHVVFGQDTACSKSILNYLLRKLNNNFYIWSSESIVTIQTAKLLYEIVKHRDMVKLILENDQFWQISKIAVVNEMPWVLLPSSVKKTIIKCLISSCDAQNNLMQMHFFNTILSPLAGRFEKLRLLKPEQIHLENTIKEVMSLIETFNGIVEGASKSIVKDIVPFALPRLEQGVNLLDVYHNYGEIVELVLHMFNNVIDKFLFNLTDWPDVVNQIYHCFLCLIQVFTRHNAKKKSIETNIEEDYFNDLLLFMTLLNTLHNIDNDAENDSNFLNNENTKQISNRQLKSVDIILVGLEFLIPLMNSEMLKFQALTLEYFRLISRVAYSNAEKLFEKPLEHFSCLVNTIQYGVNSDLGTEVVRLSLECLIGLNNKLFQTQSQQTEYGQCLRNQFRVVFNLIFKNSFEMELMDVCASTLYSFICCFQDTYSLLVNELVSEYQDESLKEKVLSGFLQLTPSNFTFNLEKRNRIKFATKFNEFCVKTYGLLFIR